MRKFSVFKSEFARNVLALMTGTTVAQFLPLMASPVLRRVFTPEQFGILALYLSISSLVAIVGTGRYHNAIVLPKHKDDAVNLLALCVGLTIFISLLTLIVIIIFKPSMLKFTNAGSDAEQWIFFVPFRVLLSNLSLSLEAWTIREKRFSLISTSRILQAILTVTINIFAGLLGFGVHALILGGMIGEGASIIMLAVRFWEKDRKNLKAVNTGEIRKQAKRYMNFPLYSLSADFINVVGRELPTLLLNIFFGKAMIGQLSLTQRIIAVPFSIVSSSALDVFKERASAEYREKGECVKIYTKTFIGLSLIGIAILVFIFLCLPFVIAFVFGEEWKESIAFAKVLSPYFVLSFVVSPLTYVFFIAERQKEDLILHSYIFLSVPLTLILGYIIFHDSVLTLLLYAVNYSMIYIVYLIRSFTLAKGQGIKEIVIQ